MEIWKSILETQSAYEISNLGNLRGVDRKVKSAIQPCGFRIIKGKPKPCQDNGKGYKQLYVKVKNKRMIFYVHRLVAMYFIPNPENKPQVNHLDGNKGNNKQDNLEWVTGKENMRHAAITGLFLKKKGMKPRFVEQNKNGVLTIWDCASLASETLGIDVSSIAKVCRGVNKTCGGSKWRYIPQSQN